MTSFPGAWRMSGIAERRVEPDRPSMELADPFHDRQTKPAAVSNHSVYSVAP